MAQRGDLRIVLRDGNRHAVLLFARVQGGDVYSGPRLVYGGDLFRHSYHASGKQHRRMPAGLSIGNPVAPPNNLTGKLQLSVVSSGPDALDWSYQAKPDAASRVTRIIEAQDVAQYPSFTSELWAFEPGRPDLMDEHLRERQGIILAHVAADWTTPNLLGYVWTLEPQAWANLARAMRQ